MIDIDLEKAPEIRKLFELYATGEHNLISLTNWCKKNNLKGNLGKKISISNIQKILQNVFYLGLMKYKREIFEGKHKPLISKKLFDKVQEILKQRGKPQKIKKHNFAFLGLMKCGSCGSGITAYEKFKKLKDGGANRHVYYFCTKAKNIDCKNPPINESSLIDELIELVDKIDLDNLGVKSKIEQEISRFNKFRIGVLGQKNKIHTTEIDIRNYTKYLLKEGTIYEKRELLSFLKSKLLLKDKKIILE